MTRTQLEWIIQRVASTSVSPSAAQRQGPPGTMSTAVRFLFRPTLIESFAQSKTQRAFISMLDEQTDLLQMSLPSNESGIGWNRGKHWGSARKFLNIFLYECTLNRQLCDHYLGLIALESLLEVPLDSYVGLGLAKEKENLESPEPVYWDTIVGLDKRRSDQYQTLATVVANRMSIARVHLDLYYLRFNPEAAD